MAKAPTFPILFEQVFQLSTTNLKAWGLLEPKQIKANSIVWNDGIFKVKIEVNTLWKEPFVTLRYTYHNKRIYYSIKLISVTSNLGFGKVWFFQCPQTKKHCRKLYLIDGYFLHREAFKGAIYDKQTESKKYRDFAKNHEAVYKVRDLYEQLQSKHFKSHYAGKPTKRYLKLLEQIDQNEQMVCKLVSEFME